MRKVAEHIYERGRRGMLYVRRRIPNAVRLAYPLKQTHITTSLGTSDLRDGKVRARVELQRIDAEFERKKQQCDLRSASMAPRNVATLTDDELQSAGRFWAREVLLNDEKRRQEGLDDEDFDELGAQLTAQRAELGRLLAQGKTTRMFPALHSFLFLCGMNYEPEPAEANRAGYLFTRAVVEALDHQLVRQSGGVLHTDVVAPETPHPLSVVKGVGDTKAAGTGVSPAWDEIFELWREFVPDRPKSTAIASQTPWRDLQRFVKEQGTVAPGDVTPVQMTEFVQSMHSRGLAVYTINERISKIRAIYKIAVGKHKLKSNPAADTLGFKESGVQSRVKKRLPFSESELSIIFGSPVFVEHKRSSGQAAEASYWLPILMYYTGARPEELAGLTLEDIRWYPGGRWYLNIVDSFADDDLELFGASSVPKSHERTVKNAPSVRAVPVAQELIDLGLLRYIDWVKERGSVVLFPGLKKDWHGKLSGSFSKFFGRYKVHIGITDKRKVLYSFRHNMKDFLEQSQFPSKYLKRFLGHASGDGGVTDGYGSGLPLEIMFEHFSRIRFPVISAKSWQPGVGPVRF